MKSVIVIIMVLVSISSHAYPYNGGSLSDRPSFEGRWFADNSPWNTPITDKTNLGYAINWQGGVINNNVWNVFTPAIIKANSNINEKQDVKMCVKFDDNANCDDTSPIGTFQIWTLQDVPIPEELKTYSIYRVSKNDTDGMTCLYDEATGVFYDFWKPVWDGSSFTATVGNTTKISGFGFSKIGVKYPHESSDNIGLGRAAGSSYCGGVIRRKEINEGEIKHALALMMPNTSLSTTNIVYPASGSDGTAESEGLPYGSLVVLNPDLTDEEMISMGLGKTDLIVAHAWQKYGAYIVDSGYTTTSAICYENEFDGSTKQFDVLTSWPESIKDHLFVVKSPSNKGNSSFDEKTQYSAEMTFQYP